MREVVTKYVTLDDLTDEQCRWLFENDESVQQEISNEVETTWLDTGREALDMVFREGSFWDKVIGYVPKLYWDGDGCGLFSVYPSGPIDLAMIKYVDVHEVLDRYPQINQLHIFMANELFTTVDWREHGDVEVYCTLQDAAIDACHLMPNFDEDRELIGEYFGLPYNSGDNERTTYAAAPQKHLPHRGIGPEENPFFEGMCLYQLLGSVDRAIEVYNETLSWVLGMADDLRNELNKVLTEEWEYIHSYEYWYEMALCNEVEYKLTEELQNVC